MFMSWGTVLTEHSSYKQPTTARYHQLLHSTDCHDGKALSGHGVTTLTAGHTEGVPYMQARATWRYQLLH